VGCNAQIETGKFFPLIARQEQACIFHSHGEPPPINQLVSLSEHQVRLQTQLILHNRFRRFGLAGTRISHVFKVSYVVTVDLNSVLSAAEGERDPHVSFTCFYPFVTLLCIPSDCSLHLNDRSSSYYAPFP
jgi:hypothetical protein